ncbi:MAG: hypothetical protein SFY68_13930 [Candidatus Sumerlaeia bacterium]|nr:hypothetical protein [Candidatus Sumerlaeia bacterium]
MISFICSSALILSFSLLIITHRKIEGITMHGIIFGSTLALAVTTVSAQPYGLEERVANTTLLISEAPAAAPEPHHSLRVFPAISLPNTLRVFGFAEQNSLVMVSPLGVNSFSLDAPEPTLGAPWFELPTNWQILDAALGNGVFALTVVDTSPVSPRVFLARHVVGTAIVEELDFEISVSTTADAHASIAYTMEGKFLVAFGDLGRPQLAEQSASFEGGVWELDSSSLLPFRKIARGLHAPRLSVDSLMGTVFVTDSSDSGIVEVNRLGENLNFGWPTMAGIGCNPSGSSCSSAGRTRPLFSVPLSGTGFVGGSVSLDSQAPDLHARFLLVNSMDRAVRVLEDTGASSLTAQVLHTFPTGAVTAIGSDHLGMVYVVVDGGLYSLRPMDGSRNSFPTRLSDIPALLNAGLGQDQTNAGIIPYEPSAKLWSDGARKERFFALPGLAKLGFQSQDGWDFPSGGVVIKNFILPLDERSGATVERRLETRLLVRHDAGWGGYSYVWNDTETDATLLPRALKRPVPLIESNGDTLDYVWDYPSRTDCFRCHTSAANVVLGLNTGQMNHSITFPDSGVYDNQLRAYEHVGLFETALPAPPEELERIPAQNDQSASLNDRARAFLHANCSYCHRPEGGGQIGTDFRWSVPLEEMGILYDRPSGFDLDIVDAWLLLPGHPEQSVLTARMESISPAYRMPPLARSRVATEDLEMMNAWITSLQMGSLWIVK